MIAILHTPTPAHLSSSICCHNLFQTASAVQLLSLCTLYLLVGLLICHFFFLELSFSSSLPNYQPLPQRPETLRSQMSLLPCNLPQLFRSGVGAPSMCSRNAVIAYQSLHQLYSNFLIMCPISSEMISYESRNNFYLSCDGNRSAQHRASMQEELLQLRPQLRSSSSGTVGKSPSLL